jgi:hypothetical protein
MDLLGLITGGLTAGTNALNARDAGMAERRKAARDDVLARIEQEREAADSEMRRETLRLQQESTARGMGYRSAGELGSVGISGGTPGVGPMGAAAGAGVSAIDGMRRGPTRTIAGQSMILDRTATPDAQAAQQQETKRRDVQSEIERRATETREQREFTSRENALNRNAAQARADAAAERSPPPANRITLSPAQIEQINGIDTILTDARDAERQVRGAIASGNNITGRVGGIIPLPSFVRDFTKQGGEAGVSARAAIGRVFSSLANDISGAAISASEMERLEKFIPSDNDTEENLQIKLNGLIRSLQTIRAMRMRNAAQYGRGGVGVTAADMAVDSADFLDQYGLERP